MVEWLRAWILDKGTKMPTRPHPMALLARDLRKRQTPAEAQLWKLLSDRRLDGVKFRRQHPIGPFVADFCCPRLRLIVEVDGGIHDESVEQDEERTRLLAASGYTVLRLRNEQVLGRGHQVLDQIVRVTQDLVRQQSG
jgi:very-short-patch-repair endonuclease